MRLAQLESTVREGSEYTDFTAHFDATADPKYQNLFKLLDNPDNDRISIISTLANVLAVDELPELPLPGKCLGVSTDVRIRNFRGNFAQTVQLEPVGRQFNETLWRASGYSTEVRTDTGGKFVRRIDYRETDIIPWSLSAQRFDSNGNLIISTVLRDYPDTPEHSHAKEVVRAEPDEASATNDDLPYAEISYGQRVLDTRPFPFAGIDLADVPFWSCVKDPKWPRQLTISSQIYTGPLSPHAGKEDPGVLGNGEDLEGKTLDIRRPLTYMGIEVGPGTFVLENSEEPGVKVDGGMLTLASSLGRFIVTPLFDTDTLRHALTF